MHARLGAARQAGKHAASAARPWPSVEKPTVRTDRPDGMDAVRYASVDTATHRLTVAHHDTRRFRRLASRPGGGGRKKAGCAVGRSILVIVWHLLNDPAARYRDLGPDWHARHTDRSRKARNAQRQLEALGYDVIITLREDAA
jgi:hypothetical protein